MNGDVEFLDFLEWAVKRYDEITASSNKDRMASDLITDREKEPLIRNLYPVSDAPEMETTIEEDLAFLSPKVKFEKLQEMGKDLEWESSLEEDLALLKASK